MRIKNIALVATVLVPSLVLASGAEHHDITLLSSDFFYRVFNFAIFAGLLYYLAANPIKAFFTGRTEGIANQLKEIEEKLEASKQDRLTAEENLVKAEEKSQGIISDAVKEAKMLSSNIAEKNENTLILLAKQVEDKKVLETKKATRETINQLLNDGFENSDVTLNEAKVVSLISKKVA